MVAWVHCHKVGKLADAQHGIHSPAPIAMLQGCATRPDDRMGTAGACATTVAPSGNTKEASGRPFSSLARAPPAPAAPLPAPRRALLLLAQ